MFRVLRFMLVIGILSVMAAWLADNPGSVTMQWRGYRIDTSFSLLLTSVAAIAVTAALLYRLWLFICRSPADISRLWREGRRRKGYMALTRGLVAVAAGDVEEAGRQSKRAEALLEDPPLTMLLSAQASQLGGDEKAAGKFFSAMREKTETEFLGLRGLLTQAMKRRHWDEALQLAEKAYKLRPKSMWVAANLFDLQVRSGRWKEAQATLEGAVNNGLVTAAVGLRRRAVLEYQLSLEVGGGGNIPQALKHVSKAHDLSREFIPASIRLARLYADIGKARKAIGVIESAWKFNPHPDLAAIYWRVKSADDAMAKMRIAQNLARHNPGHAESRIAVAGAALEANLWGEARKHLTAAANIDAPARVCRLMAELEEREHGDLTAAREWLMRASMAEADPAWVCEHCGNAVEEWGALCGKCEQFDPFSWRIPSHITRLAAHVPTTMALSAMEGEADASPAH